MSLGDECPNCNGPLGPENLCRRCGWKSEAVAEAEKTAAVPDDARRAKRWAEIRDDARCAHGKTFGPRCPFSASFFPNTAGAAPGYCTWHSEALRDPRINVFEEFARFCAKLRGPDDFEVLEVLAERGRLLPPRYCLEPSSRVLMADLSWRPIGDIRVGDQVVGFEEQIGNGRRGGHYTRHGIVSTVLGVARNVAPCIEIKTARGVLRATRNHGVLTWPRGHGPRWHSVGDVRCRSALSFFSEPWTAERTYEAGWLAALFDGEGYVCGSHGGRGRGIGFAQNTGPVLEQAVRWLDGAGVLVTREISGTRDCHRYGVRGGSVEMWRVLGRFRPVRLLQEFYGLMVSDRPPLMPVVREPVLSKTEIGTQETVDIETSTHTYIAEGFLVHNCTPWTHHTPGELWDAMQTGRNDLPAPRACRSPSCPYADPGVTDEDVAALRAAVRHGGWDAALRRLVKRP